MSDELKQPWLTFSASPPLLAFQLERLGFRLVGFIVKHADIQLEGICSPADAVQLDQLILKMRDVHHLSVVQATFNNQEGAQIDVRPIKNGYEIVAGDALTQARLEQMTGGAR